MVRERVNTYPQSWPVNRSYTRRGWPPSTTAPWNFIIDRPSPLFPGWKRIFPNRVCLETPLHPIALYNRGPLWERQSMLDPCELDPTFCYPRNFPTSCYPYIGSGSPIKEGFASIRPLLDRKIRKERLASSTRSDGFGNCRKGWGGKRQAWERQGKMYEFYKVGGLCPATKRNNKMNNRDLSVVNLKA